jgi:hypothetical protein
MAPAAPEPGLVINYAYLWHYEHRVGREEGRKDRPSVIILCVEGPSKGETVVTVLPITHRKPDDPSTAVEIPLAVGRQLGFDDDHSWVIVDEANKFTWPGYDLRQRRDGGYHYGYLPPRLFNNIRTAFLAAYKSGMERNIPRD